MTGAVMKVAIPMFKGGVSPRLDVVDGIVVYDVDAARGVPVKLETLEFSFEQPFQLVVLLRQKMVSTVICGGCPRFFLRMLHCHGFEVFSGVTGDPEELLAGFADGCLESLTGSSLGDAGNRCCSGKLKIYLEV